MSSSLPSSIRDDSPPTLLHRRGWRMLMVLILAGLFLSFSLVRSPIPGINESHYLCKARHFWQPDWCRGDLFLESANPHAVFYAAFGWLTTRLSLDQSALLIRIGQSLFLATGWLALAVRCLGDERRALTAAALFLLLQATGTWSGEWIVGGAESKVWAYGCLMLAAAWGLDRRWLIAGAATGMAISFHPVVGCWGVLIAGLAWGLRVLLLRLPGSAAPSTGESVFRQAGYSMIGGAVLCLACALPGLIPAIDSLQAPSPEIAREADYLQVVERLPHHLDPLTFPVRAWRDYVLLLLVWGLLRGRLPVRSPGLQWIERAMWSAIVIAAIGVAAAWGPRPLKEMAFWPLRVKAMKLYPFRLADMLVPFTLVLTAAAAVWQQLESLRSQRLRYGLWGVGGVAVILLAFRVPGLDRNLSQQPPGVQNDWHSACRWIREHTPATANLYATNDNWSLRWSAERPEYFHFKDCPQDAAGIVEWHRRYWQIYNWKVQAFADGRVSRAELSDLGRQTGITHLVCGRFGPLEIEPVWNSPNVKVYEVPKD